MPDTGTLGTATRRSRPPVTTAIGWSPVVGDRWDHLRAATRLAEGPLKISPTGKIDGLDRPVRKSPTNPDRTVFHRFAPRSGTDHRKGHRGVAAIPGDREGVLDRITNRAFRGPSKHFDPGDRVDRLEWQSPRRRFNGVAEWNRPHSSEFPKRLKPPRFLIAPETPRGISNHHGMMVRCQTLTMMSTSFSSKSPSKRVTFILRVVTASRDESFRSRGVQGVQRVQGAESPEGRTAPK